LRLSEQNKGHGPPHSRYIDEIREAGVAMEKRAQTASSSCSASIRATTRLHRDLHSATSTTSTLGHGKSAACERQRRHRSTRGLKTHQGAGIRHVPDLHGTYHHKTYARVHPAGTPRVTYQWRLDALSRAFEAGTRRPWHRRAVRPVGLALRRASGPRQPRGLPQKTRYGCVRNTISFPPPCARPRAWISAPAIWSTMRT